MPDGNKRFCANCGKELNTEEKFCRQCGSPVQQNPAVPVQTTQPPQPVQQQLTPPPQPVQQITPVPQQYIQPVPQPQYASQPAYAGGYPMAQPIVKKKKKHHGWLVTLIALVLIAVIIYTGFFWPAFVPRIIRKLTPMPAYCNNGYTDSVKVSANGSAKLGSLEDEGIQL